jgi:hypothetical protein
MITGDAVSVLPLPHHRRVTRPTRSRSRLCRNRGPAPTSRKLLARNFHGFRKPSQIEPFARPRGNVVVWPNVVSFSPDRD